MSRVTLDKIVDAKYRYLDANKSLPGVVEISQTFANGMIGMIFSALTTHGSSKNTQTKVEHENP